MANVKDENAAAQLLVDALLADTSSNLWLQRGVYPRSYTITDYEVSAVKVTPVDGADDAWVVLPQVGFAFTGYLHPGNGQYTGSSSDLFGGNSAQGLHLAKRHGYYILTSPLALPDVQREYGGLYIDSFIFAGVSPGDTGLSDCVECFLQAMIDENIKLQAADKDRASIAYTLDSFTVSQEEHTAIVQACIRAAYPDVPGGEIQLDIEKGRYNVPNDWLSALGFSKTIKGTEMVSDIGTSMQYDTARAIWRLSEVFSK